MSKPIAIVKDTSIVTLAENVRKLIVGVNVAGIIKSTLPAGIDITGAVKPSDIKMTHDAARAAVGAPMTSKAMIIGLSYLTLAFAYGQGKPNELTKGCKPFVQTALSHACQFFKYGAQATCVDLITAIESTVKFMLDMPKPTKSARVPTSNVIDSTSKRVINDSDDSCIDEKTGRIKTHSLAFGHEAHEDSIRESNMTLISAPHIDAAVNKMRAEKAAAEKAAAENMDIISILHGIAVNRPDFALQQLRKAAEQFGYQLRKIPTKKAA